MKQQSRRPKNKEAAEKSISKASACDKGSLSTQGWTRAQPSQFWPQQTLQDEESEMSGFLAEDFEILQ